ncbi:unnamed protein product [Nippostrongylus brasiliensis]|uniref:Caprin-1_dimer domain-containing protein n=1 Tax=Nippostrongylus brasiliensis TaxID=27835 RepID=A0A0N4XW42_NIPBR|nr:unnamed protein product [Nippostrongylus brasiliensis]
MKLRADSILASTFGSSTILEPYATIETHLEKKATYVKTRLTRLEEYRTAEQTGTTLTESQIAALNNIGEVSKLLEYVKHLISIVKRDRVGFEKAMEEADAVLFTKLVGIRSTAVSQAHVYGEVLTQLAHPAATVAFISGSNGAVKLAKDELDALQRLSAAFSPSFSSCSSLEEVEMKSVQASEIVSAVLSGQDSVVDKISGLRGCDVLALLEKVKSSEFFTTKPFTKEFDIASETLVCSPQSTVKDSLSEAEDGSGVNPLQIAGVFNGITRGSSEDRAATECKNFTDTIDHCKPETPDQLKADPAMQSKSKEKYYQRPRTDNGYDASYNGFSNGMPNWTPMNEGYSGSRDSYSSRPPAGSYPRQGYNSNYPFRYHMGAERPAATQVGFIFGNRPQQ